MADQMMGPAQPQTIDGRLYDSSHPGTTSNYGRIEALMPPANKIREVHIQQLSHGYIVNVGCQTFAIEKPSDLIAKLSEYILNPLATEKKWDDGKLF